MSSDEKFFARINADFERMFREAREKRAQDKKK